MPILYSTGPLENAFPDPTVKVALKALNNSDDDYARVGWTLYGLDGGKRPLGSVSVHLHPKASAFVSLPVNAVEFEIEALVVGHDADDTLIAVFGEDSNGNPVAVHRVLYSEMTVIKGGKPIGDKPGTDGDSE